MASFFNNLGQRIDQGIAGLYNRDQIVDLENQYGNQYGVQDTSGGVASDARHIAAMNNLSNTIAGPINNISPSLGTFVGDLGAFGAGLINEIPALARGFNRQNFGEIGEDIVANFKGTFGTPNSATAEDIYSQVFSGAVPQRFASGAPMGYGTAQASELTNLERDFPGNQQTGIMQQAPTQNFEFLSSAYEDENEDDQQVDYSPEQPKSFKDSATLQEYFQNRNPLKGVGGLLGLITGNPIFGLISGGAKGLGALNNKMQNSMFGQSKNLAEYFNNRKIAQAAAARADTISRARQQNPNVYASADKQGFTGPGGGFKSAGTNENFSNKTGKGRTGY